jgi:hypothetical protein
VAAAGVDETLFSGHSLLAGLAWVAREDPLKIMKISRQVNKRRYHISDVDPGRQWRSLPGVKRTFCCRAPQACNDPNLRIVATFR